MVLRKKKDGAATATQIKRQNAVRIAPRAWDNDFQSPKSDLSEKIRNRAYFLYLERGCQDGNDMEDWLKAERLVKSGR